MKKILFLSLIAAVIIAVVSFVTFIHLSISLPPAHKTIYSAPAQTSFAIQSIDTMKYSRDLSREKLKDPSFDAIIDQQVGEIANTGATHVAIATPYDSEFLPFLKRWVSSAREHKLRVWFKGNWSGWEGWFGYSRIGQEDHMKKTEQFVLDNPDLFEDGDAFSSCPECENGGPGDPRQTGNVTEYRKFLIAEHNRTKEAFQKIHKDVESNLFPMNGDVANLVMDKATTQALGGIVTVDHYVKTPDQFSGDLENLAKKSGGRIFVGEFGVPIPDIHGKITDQEQAKWIEAALANLLKNKAIYGVNYWIGVGGSTEIWDSNGKAKDAVAVIEKYFRTNTAYGSVRDELGQPISNVNVQYENEKALTDDSGYFSFSFVGEPSKMLIFSKPGYIEQKISVSPGLDEKEIVLIEAHKTWKNKLMLWIKKKM